MLGCADASSMRRKYSLVSPSACRNKRQTFVNANKNGRGAGIRGSRSEGARLSLFFLRHCQLLSCPAPLLLCLLPPLSSAAFTKAEILGIRVSSSLPRRHSRLSVVTDELSGMNCLWNEEKLAFSAFQGVAERVMISF